MCVCLYMQTIALFNLTKALLTKVICLIVSIKKVCGNHNSQLY